MAKLKKRFASGKYKLKNSNKYLGKNEPTYRSSWEFSMMQFCDKHPSVVQWASESIKIPYRNPLTGQHTIYIPDFFIVTIDKNGKQHADLIEVKPQNQAIQEKVGKSKTNQIHYVINQAKWEAAKSWCSQRGIRFQIITENEIYHQGRKR